MKNLNLHLVKLERLHEKLNKLIVKGINLSLRIMKGQIIQEGYQIKEIYSVFL